jgi:hypothetical protein
VLVSFFGEREFDFNVTSEVMPGVVRSFNSFEAADKEATLRRSVAGVHVRTDEGVGQPRDRGLRGRQLFDARSRTR